RLGNVLILIRRGRGDHGRSPGEESPGCEEQPVHRSPVAPPRLGCPEQCDARSPMNAGGEAQIHRGDPKPLGPGTLAGGGWGFLHTMDELVAHRRGKGRCCWSAVVANVMCWI